MINDLPADFDKGGEDGMAAEPVTGGGPEQCVPIGALATVDESDAPSQPAVGDRVTYQVEGAVTRIEGDKAFVRPSAINGEPVQEAPEPPGSETANEADEYAGLKDQATKMGGL